MLPSLRLMLLSTSVGPLGSGKGGGVELTLQNIANTLRDRGHHLTLVAPEGSVLPDWDIVQIPGQSQITAQSQGRDAPITLPPQSVLAAMWDYARLHQSTCDVLINFAYDWLPFYLTPFFQRPIAHLVSMGSLSDAMDAAICQVAHSAPHTLAAHSHTQAATFPCASAFRVVGNGLDLSRYQFQPRPGTELGWVGRIAPEKGLEDAVAAAQQTGQPLRIWGAMTDEAYWQEISRRYPEAPICYEGFLATEDLQRALGKCQGLLMTPRWVEAFGNVAIEALACGVPVIAYDRGGPSEIVRSGETGWLVPPDQVSGLVDAIARLPQIDRQTCRRHVETQYSNAAMGDRIEQWLADILNLPSPTPSECP